MLLDMPGLCKAVELLPPDLESTWSSQARRLGSSLFGCCNYASQKLGREVPGRY
ncbi:MAG: hypothetical protein AB7S98_23105 [Burkholderiaceae bacterium]